MDQNLFKELKQTGLAIKKSRTLTGRELILKFDFAEIKSILKTLNKRMGGFRRNFSTRLERQFSHWSSAEANVVDNPNVETFFCFGSYKIVDRCLQAYYLHEFFPVAFAKVIADNPDFEEALQERIPGMKNMTKFKQKEEVFCRILAVLCETGARGLGGRNISRSLQGLRIVRKLPNRPKKKVFRRGYNDKGSLANEQTKVARQVEKEYFDRLTSIVFSFEKIYEKYTFKIRQSNGEIVLRLMHLKNGYSYDEARSLIQQAKKKLEELNDWITLNGLSAEIVTKDLIRINSELRG